MKLKNAFYEVLISPTHVPEMNRLEVTEEGLVVGGAVSLTKMAEKLKKLVRSMPGVYVCVEWEAEERVSRFSKGGGGGGGGALDPPSPLYYEY